MPSDGGGPAPPPGSRASRVDLLGFLSLQTQAQGRRLSRHTSSLRSAQPWLFTSTGPTAGRSDISQNRSPNRLQGKPCCLTASSLEEVPTAPPDARWPAPDHPGVLVQMASGQAWGNSFCIWAFGGRYGENGSSWNAWGLAAPSPWVLFPAPFSLADACSVLRSQQRVTSSMKPS